MTSHETTPHCSFSPLSWEKRKEKPSQYLPSHEKGAFPIRVKSPSSLSLIQSQWQIGLLTTIMAGQHLSLSLSIAYTYLHAQVLTCICQFSLCFSFVVDVYCALVCAELALRSRAPITAWLRPTPECLPVTVFSLVITPKSVNCTLPSFIFFLLFSLQKKGHSLYLFSDFLFTLITSWNIPTVCRNSGLKFDDSPNK